MTNDRRGFTIVEVMVAVLILTIGIIALAGASGLTHRMLGQGRMSTVASELAVQRLEVLRATAEGTATPCASAAFATGTATVQNVALRWEVPSSGDLRTVRVIATYRTPAGGTRRDTVATYIRCTP